MEGGEREVVGLYIASICMILLPTFSSLTTEIYIVFSVSCIPVLGNLLSLPV